MQDARWPCTALYCSPQFYCSNLEEGASFGWALMLGVMHLICYPLLCTLGASASLRLMQGVICLTLQLHCSSCTAS